MFVNDLMAIGAAVSGEESAKAKPTPKTDKHYAVEAAGALIKRMRKAVEKQDGSMTPEQMKKLEAWIEDGLKALAIK